MTTTAIIPAADITQGMTLVAIAHGRYGFTAPHRATGNADRVTSVSPVQDPRKGDLVQIRTASGSTFTVDPDRDVQVLEDAPVEPTEQDARVIAAYDAARAEGKSPLVAAKMAVAAVAQADAAEQARLEEPQALPFGAVVDALKGNGVDLSEAATWVVVAVTQAKDASMDAYERGHIDGAKRAALNVWTALTGIQDQEEAINAAVALARGRVRAHVPPM